MAENITIVQYANNVTAIQQDNNVVISSVGVQGPGVASGGTVGQVLVKSSSVSYDTSWTSSVNYALNSASLGGQPASYYYPATNITSASVAYATNSASSLFANISASASDSTKLPLAGGTMSGSIAMSNNAITGANSIQVTGLIGANQNPIRMAGATTSGPPISGTYVVGDFIIDNTATIWICTASGTPGTWSPTIQSSLVNRSATATAGNGEQTIFTGSTPGQTITLPANPQNGAIYQIKNLSSNLVYINGGTNSISVSGQIHPPYFTATTAVSAILTNISSFNNLAVGMALTSTYVPTGTTISILNSPTNITMSANATTAASLQNIKVLVTIPINTAYGFVYNNSLNTWYLINTTDLAQMGNILPITKGGTGLNSIGTANQVLKVNSTASALEWSDTPLPATASFSNITVSPSSSTAATMSANSDNPTLVVKRYNSAQSSAIQEWQTESGSSLAAIFSGGTFYAGNIRAGTSGTLGAVLNAQAPTAGTTIGLVVRGGASQSVDLQQWQNNGTTVLAKVDLSGNMTATSFTGSGTGLTAIPASATTGTAVTQADLLTTFFGYPTNGYETFPRLMTSTAGQPSNQQLSLTLFTPIKTVTISTLSTNATTSRLDYGYSSAYRGQAIYQMTGTTASPLAVTWDGDTSLWVINNMTASSTATSLTTSVASNSNNFTIVTCTGTGASFTTGQWVNITGGTGGFTDFTGKVVGLPTTTSWILQVSGSGVVSGTMNGGTASGRSLSPSTCTITSGSITSGTGTVATASIVCNTMSIPFSPGIYVNIVGSVNSLDGVVAASPVPTATSFTITAPSTLTSGSIGTGTATQPDAWGRYVRKLYVPTAGGTGVVTPASVTLTAGTTYAIGTLSSQTGGTTSTPSLAGAPSTSAMGFFSPIISLGATGQTTITSASITVGTQSPPVLWTRMT